MSGSAEINCSIAFWYYRRMLLVIALMAIGGGWFFYDGKVGWPEKNVAAVAKRAFEAAADGNDWNTFSSKDEVFVDSAVVEDSKQWKLIREAHGQGGMPRPWSEFIKSSPGRDALGQINNESILKDAYLAGAGGILSWVEYASGNDIPANKNQAKPDSKHGQYGWEAIESAFKGASKKREWSFYGSSTGYKHWKVKDPVYHFSSEIKGQLWIANILWILAGLTFFYMIIGSRRRLSADAESLTTESGIRILFDSVHEIDRRKWAKKGLAYLKYRNDDGTDKRAVIDDLKYREADQIFERLLVNFSGKLIEEINDEAQNEEAS